MNLHEYQSKRLFADYGIPVPEGTPASTPDEAVAAAEALGGDLWVVKAQVHAGGRGKAGGVKLARTMDEVREAADGMLGTMLVTHQSGPEGLPVNVVYVEAGSDIDRELYLSMLVDREASRIAFIASAAGGMDIEQVAAETPEKIFTVVVAPSTGLMDYQARQLAFGLGLEGPGALAGVARASHADLGDPRVPVAALGRIRGGAQLRAAIVCRHRAQERQPARSHGGRPTRHEPNRPRATRSFDAPDPSQRCGGGLRSARRAGGEDEEARSASRAEDRSAANCQRLDSRSQIRQFRQIN